jgi:hypothetical protein
MVSDQAKGMNPFVLPSSMMNNSTHSRPWASNPFSFGIPNMTSHLSSSISTAHVNPSFRYGCMTPPYTPCLFGGGHIPQPNPMVGGWNPSSSGPNPCYTFLGWSAQMGCASTYYNPFIYPSSTILSPMNTFIMKNLTLTSGVSSVESQFYSMGNPTHIVPSSGGKIYPHMSSLYHVAFSSQVDSLVMIPLQPFMNQLGG